MPSQNAKLPHWTNQDELDQSAQPVVCKDTGEPLQLDLEGIRREISAVPRSSLERELAAFALVKDRIVGQELVR
jgi:hypothetical protein